MKKIIFLITLLFTLFLLACKPNIYYVKTELKGELYNSKTKKPISKQVGFVSFYLNEDGQVQTNQKGQFKINAVSKKYYFIKPNMQEVSMSAPQLYINFKGYKSKIIDYTENSIVTEATPNIGANTMETIDIGIIYLDPEKN